jgi:hypothetical protein
MLQREGRGARRRERSEGEAGSSVRRGVALVRAYDHGVDPVNDSCEDHPEYGRQEKTADDLEYGMGLEEAGCGASGPEASELRLQGWERRCLHCAYLYRQR